MSAGVRGTRRAFIATIVTALAVALFGAAPVPASAGEATSTEVSELADAAREGDGAALVSLEAVTSVDGRPAYFAQALTGAEGEALQARLREIEQSVARSGTADPGTPIREVVQRPPERSQGQEGGGGGIDLGIGAPGIAQVIVVAVIIALAIALATFLGRRRVLDVAARGAATGVGGEPEQSPRSLERLAVEAERAGDFDAALGLRFKAGLIRLDEAGAVRLRPSLTPSGAARETGSRTLSGLAGTYSRVLYGGRRAEAEDARDSRESWPLVLGESRPHSPEAGGGSQ